jgi:hypothetical protein
MNKRSKGMPTPKAGKWMFAAVIGIVLGTALTFAQEQNPKDVHYVPTQQPVVDKMLELAALTKNDVVYDLGSGDGRIVITAAQ